MVCSISVLLPASEDGRQSQKFQSLSDSSAFSVTPIQELFKSHPLKRNSSAINGGCSGLGGLHQKLFLCPVTFTTQFMRVLGKLSVAIMGRWLSLPPACLSFTLSLSITTNSIINLQYYSSLNEMFLDPHVSMNPGWLQQGCNSGDEDIQLCDWIMETENTIWHFLFTFVISSWYI